MAYVSNTGTTIYDVVEAMDNLLVSVGWIQHRRTTKNYNNQPRTDHVIWEGSGDGTDKIYIQVKVINNQRMYLDSMVGYDEALQRWEQPGSIQQQLLSAEESTVAQPMFTVTNEENFAYWIFADTWHVIGVARMGLIYESFYMGFLNPISSERQYPYPMYVAGNGSATSSSWPNNNAGSFIFPHNNSGWLRRADGVWRSFDAQPPSDFVDYTNPDPDSVGTVFPYSSHNGYLIPNYSSSSAIAQDNFLLIPVMLNSNNPVDICGIMRNVFWVSGTRDIGTEQILVFGADQYIVFDNKQSRFANSYFCIKMS